jgi:NADH:ubiquinone oxidoreductase subunit 3 (subunit A)
MSHHKKLNQKTVLIGLAVALLFVVLGVFCFSYALETLDLKAEELGLEAEPIYKPPFPDYKILGMDNQWSALLIGVVSMLLLFVVAFGVAKLLNKRKNKT